jgi:hypothetical protein
MSDTEAGRPPLDATTTPASFEAATVEMDAMLNTMRGIDEQLGRPTMEREGRRMTGYEYQDWRRRALVSRRLAEQRYRFLKRWKAEQRELTRAPAPASAGLTTKLARDLSRRVAAMEAIAIAAMGYHRTPGDDQRAELFRTIQDCAEDAGLRA